jgi:hypothetical protein
MNLDIRIPTGLLFSIIGAILAIYGAATRGAEMYQKSLDINMNFWWGLALVVFGLAMLGLAWRASGSVGKRDGVG